MSDTPLALPFGGAENTADKCPYRVGDEIEFFSASSQAYVYGKVMAVIAERHIRVAWEDGISGESIWGDDGRLPFKVQNR